MRRLVLVPLALVVLLPLAACGGEEEPDAYGNVEATEVVVGAEASGVVEAFTPRQGVELAAGEAVARIDATGLRLERDQLAAQQAASAARLDEVAQQIEVLAAQHRVAERAYERTRRLYEQRAATAQQLDQVERDYRVLGEQIEAARAQVRTVRREIEAAGARVAQVDQRIADAVVVNPVAGTVLATYARAGEVVQAGQPLYRIADLEVLEVRAYVTETQLASTRLGRRATVTVDVGGEARRTLPGTVSWIASEAEFTPTPIQTREERADLVYAIEVRVPNPDGVLKIGMPADVDLHPESRPEAAPAP